MEKGKCAMDSFKDHHMEEEEEVKEGKCLINNPSQDNFSSMPAASTPQNQVNLAGKDVIEEVSMMYKPVPVLSKRVVSQRARRERERECSDHQSIKLANDARALAQRTRRERERNQCNLKNEEPAPKVENPLNFHHQQQGSSPTKLEECNEGTIKLDNDARTLAQRARRERERNQCNSKNEEPAPKVETPSDFHHQQQGKSPIKLKESNEGTIKLANDARALAQRARRKRERDQCNSNNEEPNSKVESPSNFPHQKQRKSPIKLQTMSQQQPNYSQPTQCNSKNVPFSKVELPSNFQNQQQGKNPIKFHTMRQKQPSSSQPNQQLASGNPPWLIRQQSPVLAQSPIKKFNTSAVMKHISVMLAAKKTNPVMGVSIYKDCGTAPGFSSRSSKATLPTQKRDNKSEIPSRTSLSSNGVLSKSASSTPGGNTAAAATVNAPPPILAGERNASAVVLGPGSNHGVLDTSGFAIGSSPTKYSSPPKKELIRRPSPSLPKIGFGSDPARFSIAGCDSNRSLISFPLRSGCVVASPSSLVEAPAVSDFAKGNTSGSDNRIETHGIMQPSLSSVENRVMLPKISKVSKSSGCVVASPSSLVEAPAVSDFAKGNTSGSDNRIETHGIMQPSLSSVENRVMLPKISKVSKSSGCVVASPSSLVEAPAVSDLAKGNTSGSGDRIETSGVMQPPLSSVDNRVMLPKLSKVSNTTDLTESNNDGKPADLGGGVFSISEVPVEQWRLAREFSRTQMKEQANPDTVLPNSDKQNQKETTLRTLKNDDSMVKPKPLISKDRGPFVDTNMVSRVMIPAAESSQGPICPINRSAGGHLVYTRKKFKQEPLLKNNSYEKDTNTGCTQQDHREQQSSQQQAQSEGTNKSCFTTGAPFAVTAPTASNRASSPFLMKPLDELQSRELNHPTNSSSLTHPGTSQGMNEQHWRARFLRLETKLRNCDHSRHEEYIQMFQRLPSVDHREHAVELERRAMKLLVEEGHELLMMKHLNVLGKPASVERFPTEK